MKARYMTGGKVQLFFKHGRAQLSASGDTVGEAMMSLRTALFGAPPQTRLRLVEEGRAVAEQVKAAASRKGAPPAPKKKAAAPKKKPAR